MNGFTGPLIGVLLAATAQPASAWACASCGLGDPTLTSMGTEAPSAGRLRVSAALSGWQRSFGTEGVDAEHVQELRMELSAAWAPLSWLFLSASLPLQARELQGVGLAPERGFGPGDLSVTARAFVWRDRAFAPHHLVSVLAGARLPTSVLQRDASGAPLSLDAQLGTASFDPIAGLAYSGFWTSHWSVYLSATGYLPTRGRMNFRAGPELRSTLAAQYQPDPRWALRLGLDGRLTGPAEEDGEPDPSDAGFVGYLSPDLLWSPRSDWTVEAGLRIPVIRQLQGAGHEGPLALVSLSYDL